jgi:hypothetical protein
MKKTINRHALTAEEKAEAARLKAAWEAFKAATPGASQEWLGRETGIGGQSAVSQYLRGDLALNFANLIKLCNVMRVDPSAISARLVKEHLGAPALDGDLFARTVRALPPDVRDAVHGASNSSNRGRKSPLSEGINRFVESMIELEKRQPETAARQLLIFEQQLTLVSQGRSMHPDRRPRDLLEKSESEAQELYSRVREPGATNAAATHRKSRRKS